MSTQKLNLFFDNLRASITILGLPDPLANATQNLDFKRFDTNISDIGNKWKPYPDPILNKQKERYLSFISEIEKKKGITTINFNPENLLFTTGAVDGLDLLLKCLIHEKNTSVILPVPTFIGFHHWLQIYGAQTNYIELRGKAKNRVSVNDVCSQTSRILLLCNPNNPLGTQIPTKDIRLILDCFNGLVIIDEAYIDFSNVESSAYLLHKYPNLIILRTCSKSLGIAGLRIGAILAHKTIIETLLKVQPVYNMPSPVISNFDEVMDKGRTKKIFNQI